MGFIAMDRTCQNISSPYNLEHECCIGLLVPLIWCILEYGRSQKASDKEKKAPTLDPPSM